MSKQRKYLPTLGELIDKLSICQLKEWKITDHRKEYEKEIADILHDINIILKEKKIIIDADFIRNVIVLATINELIWQNEGNWRKGIREGNNLELTHGLNSIRNNSRNRMEELFGGRKDYKLDNVEAFKQWIPSGYEK